MNLKEINTIIRCFNEIDTFSLHTTTQRKIINNLKKRTQEKNRLYNKVRHMNKEDSVSKLGDKFQIVAFEMSDGNTYFFTGPSIEGDDVEIVDIRFSKPLKMKNGMKFNYFRDYNSQGCEDYD